MVDTEDMRSCNKCGVFFDITKAEKIRGEFSGTYYICPCCRSKNPKEQ